MSTAAPSGAQRRRRRALRTRALLFLAMALGAGLTGLWWDHARDDGLDLPVGLSALVERSDGRITVTEELTFSERELGEEHLVRTIEPDGDGRVTLLGVEASDEHEVLVLPRPDEGLTVLIPAEAGRTPVTLRYEIRGDGDVHDLGTLNAPLARVQVDAGATPVAGDSWPANEPFTFLSGQPPVPPTPDGSDIPWDAIGGAVGALAALVWLASLLRTRPEPPATAGETGGLPSSHSPAVVGWLLRHGRVTPADLAATVVDLTSRGFILPFRPADDRLVLGQGRPGIGLHRHEELVLEWVFADRAREADLAAKRAAIAETPTLWSDLWDGFVDGVERAGREDDLIEREVASPAVLAVAALGLALLTAGVVGTSHGYPGWLAVVVAGALVVAGATAFARRSPEGESLARRWEAFGLELRAGAGITPHALSYAVTLGEDRAATDRLAEQSDDWPAQLIHDEVERHVVGWREAYLSATSVRGEPSQRVRALLSLRALRRRSGRAVPAA